MQSNYPFEWIVALGPSPAAFIYERASLRYAPLITMMLQHSLDRLMAPQPTLEVIECPRKRSSSSSYDMDERWHHHKYKFLVWTDFFVSTIRNFCSFWPRLVAYRAFIKTKHQKYYMVVISEGVQSKLTTYHAGPTQTCTNCAVINI